MRRRHLTWGLVIVGVVVLLAVLGRQAAPERVAGGGAVAGAEQEAVAAAGGEAVEAVGAGAREVAPLGAETRVRVHVRDEDGIAIEGAVVTLWPQDAELQRPDRQAFAKGLSDAAGAVRLAAAQGEWNICAEPPQARAAQFAIAGVRQQLPRGDSEVTLVMRRFEASVCVHVHDDLGTPIRGIGVEAQFRGMPNRTAKTDAAGNAWFERVPAPDCYIRVSEDDLAGTGPYGTFAKSNDLAFEVTVQRRSSTRVSVATLRGARLELEPPSAVADTAGQRLTLTVYGSNYYSRSSLSTSCQFGGTIALLGPVPPGRYRVDVTFPASVDFTESQVPDVELAPGESRRLVIPMRKEPGRIGGLVIGPDGRPVDRVGVSAWTLAPDGRFDIASNKGTHTDRNGRFLLRGMPEGVRVLDVWVNNHPAGPFRYVDREDHHYAPGVDDVVIQLRVGHQIRGKLLLDGKPSAEGDVDIRPGRFRTQTDRASIEQAQFTFEHVRPGRHRLTWRIDGRVVCERDVDVPDLPETTTVEVELSATR